jgi:hypothetical protein
LQAQVNPNESMTDSSGSRRLSDWIRRSFGAMMADLEFVDARSLDVLLYCGDGLAMNALDVEVERAQG